jgi:hypothetical protein
MSALGLILAVRPAGLPVRYRPDTGRRSPRLSHSICLRPQWAAIHELNHGPRHEHLCRSPGGRGRGTGQGRAGFRGPERRAQPQAHRERGRARLGRAEGARPPGGAAAHRHSHAGRRARRSCHRRRPRRAGRPLDLGGRCHRGDREQDRHRRRGAAGVTLLALRNGSGARKARRVPPQGA